MRNLTLTRRKSFVGCAMKDQVYIRDEQANELTIDGVPCRKIGDIKNGETKTFQIPEGEQQIFMIVDKVSKDYCNATVTVPEGQEDVTLAGKHKFSFGSNSFCFDGVQMTEEQLKKQKKNGRKGAVITIAAVVVGVVLGQLLSGGFFDPEPSPKTFTEGDFQITLTDEFKAAEEDGFYAFYESKDILVFAIQEEKEIFGDITLEEYGDLVLEANGKTGGKMNRGEGFLWFDYTDTVDGQEVYYMAVCCQGEEAFWIVNFATPVENRTQKKDVFLNWAKTIKAG